MYEKEVVEFCIKHKVKVEQYFFMWFILSKSWTRPHRESLVKLYLRQVGNFRIQDIEDLEERGFLENANTPPNTYPELYFVKESISSEIFASDDAGEELWKKYPASFPLSDGGSFIARGGGDKDELIADYLVRINNSPSLHRFVISQIEVYKELVGKRQLNGYKLSDFIKMELWNTIAEIQGTNVKKGGGFGKDL